MILSLLLAVPGVPELLVQNPDLREVYGIKDDAIYYTSGWDSVYHQWPSGRTFAKEKGKAWQVLGIDKSSALVLREVVTPTHLGGAQIENLSDADWPRQSEFRIRGPWALRLPMVGNEPFAVYRNGRFAAQFQEESTKNLYFYAMSPFDGSIGRVQFKN